MNHPVHMSLHSDQFPTDGVHVRRIRGREHIGRLFHFDINVLCTESTLAAEDVVGMEASLVLSRGNDERTIAGMISHFDEHFSHGHGGASYRLRLVPRAHRLNLVRTQDIFMDYSIPELIEHKLEMLGLEGTDVDATALLGQYGKREFVVQYDETDLAFVSRLAEHLGISFYYDCSSGHDKLVFTDHNGGFGSLADTPTLTLEQRTDEPGLHKLRLSTKVIPAAFVVMDYNNETPDVELTSMTEAEEGYGGGFAEWGDHFKTTAAGDALAKVRAQEHECQRAVYHGRSDVVQVAAGYHYEVDGHERLEDVKLLVTEVEHQGSQPVALHGGHDDQASYENNFVAIPSAVPFRPARRTPKPKIAGLMSGVVEPRELGEVERYARVDKQGRYQIKFLFDTVPLGERLASRPVRKAEPTVGPDYGMHFPLKPGVEVVMSFVNGDPDRPIIVGAVYNTQVPSPVLDANSRTNIIKSASGIGMRCKDD